jgi:hypothetical protein
MDDLLARCRDTVNRTRQVREIAAQLCTYRSRQEGRYVALSPATPISVEELPGPMFVGA